MRLVTRLPAILVALVVSASAFAQVGPVRDRQQPSVVRAGTASIVGRVFAADSGRPLRLARVTAAAPELADGRVAMTDENGAFEFSELPAGHYMLAASKAGYIMVNFGQRRPLRAGRPIEVRDGQRVRDIDFRLPRGSAITGRVMDQDGEPLVRATIRALRYRFVQGERRIEPGGASQSDDRGIFRIYGLTPGTYFVSAAAQTADITAMPPRQDGRGTADASRPAETYAPTYYPGVAAMSDAAPVTVGVADEVMGVDFTLQIVTAARVTGTVRGSNGAPATAAAVQLVPEDSRGISGQTYSAALDRGGTFSIANVPPGRYLVIAFGGGRGQQGSPAYSVQPLSVSGTLVSDVTLVLAPGMTVSGQVTFDGATTPSAQDVSRIRIGLWAPASASLPGFGASANTTPRPDGSFTIPNLPPGTRMVRVSGLPQSWTLKAVYLDGRDVTDEMVDLKSAEAAGRVTIVVTDRVTTLTGTVLDDHGVALSDYTVIAFPADSNLWRPMSRVIQAARSDKDGVYTLRGLPPGEYLLRATDDVDQGEWYDPDLLETLRAGAVRVLLQEGDVKSQDLKMLVK